MIKSCVAEKKKIKTEHCKKKQKKHKTLYFKCRPLND